MKKLNIQHDQVILMYNKGMSCQKIADALKCSESYINKMLRTKGITKRTNVEYRTKQQFQHDYFSKINTEDKAYWLGVLMADGCITVKKSGQKMIQLVVKDEELPVAFIKAIQGNFKRKQYNDIYGVYLTSPQMFKDLNSHGCTLRKSLTLKFPQLPDDLIHHFIRGYFDGDGSVYIHHPKNYNNTDTLYTNCGVCIMGTFEFLNIIQTHIGGNLKKEYRRESNTWKLTFSGRNKISVFYKYLYQDATTCLLRKRNKFEKYLKKDVQRL